MFINDVLYQTNMHNINLVREVLFSNLYGDQNKIEELKNIICKYIDCSSIEFDNSRFSFIIKIKKTSMRKNKSFDHNPNFYYTLASNIFNEFLHLNEASIIVGITMKGESHPTEVLSGIYDNSTIMSNLCSITCISDNVLQFHL